MTKKEALQKVFNKRVKAYAELHSLAEKLNEGWEPNWLDEDENKYYIATDFNQTTVHARTRFAAAGMVFFETQEKAEQAIKQIDTELLIDNLSSFLQKLGDDNSYVIIPTVREVTNAAIKHVTDFGFVTSLDLKSALRADGFYMVQGLASGLLEEIAKEFNWETSPSSDGTYKIYAPKFF